MHESELIGLLLCLTENTAQYIDLGHKKQVYFRNGYRYKRDFLFYFIYLFIFAVGLWVLWPLTGLLYQPQMIGDGDCGETDE
jgi:hypothetical protein